MHERGYSQKSIAKTIGVHKSTISRKLRRNCDQLIGFIYSWQDVSLSLERKRQLTPSQPLTPNPKRTI